uniref:Uncharacterized protein n=1 Tax=Chromera velia CCMP2878 TaxID=1169474 RepID=A0A0G4HVG3_9ALVE|eukprot:Cvel_32278.t1-p1 / transcript=Cvel_32278.t1 / gene=Cvel_32278 / organism=Chromera_velia_CCMP2878 / gene_product=hypothetical protein / transcript_product=hypothetical protein / location=Cvel_scaffold4983:1507-2166(+) / protein_length=191 / sequence_SO=supercontig / SO=protein_coding / is_pseudo=false
MTESEFDQVFTAAIVIKIILSLFGIKSSMFSDAVSTSTKTTGGLSSVSSPRFSVSPSASSEQQVQIAADPQIKMEDINYDSISYKLLATLAKTIGLVKKLRKVRKRGHSGQNSSSRSRSRPPPQSCSAPKKGNCPNCGLEHGSKAEDCYSFEKKCNYKPCRKKGHFERMCCKKKANEGKAGGFGSSSSSSN